MSQSTTFESPLFLIPIFKWKGSLIPAMEAPHAATYVIWPRMIDGP